MCIRDRARTVASTVGSNRASDCTRDPAPRRRIEKMDMAPRSLATERMFSGQGGAVYAEMALERAPVSYTH